jgi:hypothetical protein
MKKQFNETIQVSNALPSGEYANIRCYDNGGKTFDRYTVIYMDEPEPNAGRNLFASVGMSENPFHPQGFGQHCAAMPGKHLGKRISFYQLPDKCRKLVMQDLKG